VTSLTPGTCGSCWAITATGVIEGQVAIATKKAPTQLGPQKILDCVAGTCSGSNPAYGLLVGLVIGLPAETTYGYAGSSSSSLQNTCWNSITSYKLPVVGAINGLGCVASCNEAVLASALVQYGPISVSLRATDSIFKVRRLLPFRVVLSS
jgi:hypothetical protein